MFIIFYLRALRICSHRYSFNRFHAIQGYKATTIQEITGHGRNRNRTIINEREQNK